jgi:2-polyprenyl-3-methyl-5-hydroxy-6-metoxy-1,4-benzoquinol methylase
MDCVPSSMNEYYAELGELARLTETSWGRLEYDRTREIVERVIPDRPADVLDVGGGTGVHAVWLAAAGHRVHVIDPEPRHVEHAALLPGVTASTGDARDLDRPSASADVVLLLGPLYHLADPADRLRALAEASRVARPGGVVVAATIGRYASMIDMAAFGRLTDEAVLQSVRQTVRTGEHDPALGFTTAYFHTADEIRAEFASAGLLDVRVLGVEGPGYSVLKLAGAPAELTEAVYASVWQLARETEEHPGLIEANSHLLTIGRVPTLDE